METDVSRERERENQKVELVGQEKGEGELSSPPPGSFPWLFPAAVRVNIDRATSLSSSLPPSAATKKEEEMNGRGSQFPAHAHARKFSQNVVKGQDCAHFLQYTSCQLLFFLKKISKTLADSASSCSFPSFLFAIFAF